MGRIEHLGEDLKGQAERIGGARPTVEAIGDSLGARVGNGTRPSGSVHIRDREPALVACHRCIAAAQDPALNLRPF
jgi:hypothetical protein